MPPTVRAVRSARWFLWPLAAVATLLAVGQASYASFTDKTSNSANTFAVGSVNLADNDSGSALLSLANLKPGSAGSRCIAVASTGTLPSSVKLYTSDAAVTKGLAGYVNLTVTQGSGAAFGSCSGFTALSTDSSVYSGTLAAFTAAATTFGSGVGNWAPTGSGTETRSFQFAYSVSSSTPDSAQGGTAGFGLTWEAQTT